MTRAYGQLLPIVAAWPSPTPESLWPLRERLERSMKFFEERTRQGTEERRVKREQVYMEMYARSARVLDKDDVPLSEHIAPIPVGNDEEAGAGLRDLLQHRFGAVTAADDGAIGRMVNVLMDYLRREQAIVRRASDIQKNINRLLGRRSPSRALTGTDLAIHYRLLASIYPEEQLASLGGRLPYLVDDLEETLGLRIVVSGEAMNLVDAGSAGSTCDGHGCNAMEMRS